MSILKNSADESGLISQRNIGHYDQNATSYDEGTQGHDVSQNINALLRAIKTKSPFHLLDFGCGPGRDLKALTKLGHLAIVNCCQFRSTTKESFSIVNHCSNMG
jgi:SAM-dependent methyltransferase